MVRQLPDLPDLFLHPCTLKSRTPCMKSHPNWYQKSRSLAINFGKLCILSISLVSREPDTWVYALVIKRSRLIQLYKILNGLTPGVQLPADYLPQITTTRHSHSSRFVLPAARTTSYQTNFFYHTVSDWNNLQATFYNIPTLDLFTHTLNTYM